MRRSNLLRAFLSLVVLLVAFAIYSVTVVPAIEPNFQRQTVTASSNANSSSSYLGEFANQVGHLFPAGSWETQSPRVLRDDRRRTAMLFKEYEIIDGGGLRITPCTVIYGTDAVDDNGVAKPPLIMQGDGATIYFDKPIDLSKIQFGQPESGQLLGQVRIQRAADSSGRGGLVVDTSNVQITPDGLLAPNEFTFEYEKSTGSGNNLIIKIDKVRSGQKPSFDIVQSVELVTLHKLYLNPETADPLGDSKVGSGQRRQKQAPTQVTCDGPCRIDFRRNTLSFSKAVDLRRLNENVAHDVLECDALTIFFAESLDAGVTSDKTKAPDFQVKRLLAVGDPVTLNAPSRFAYLRGSRLEYDITSRKFRMTSTTQSSFRHVTDEAEHRLIAPRITYNAPDVTRPERDRDNDTVGTLFANGAGRFDATIFDKDQHISVLWDNRLSLKDDMQQSGRPMKLLTVDGNVEARLDTTGVVEAGHVDIWLEPSPALRPTAARAQASEISLRPHRIEATQQVDFNSPKLTAQCEQLETTFRHTLQKAKPAATQGASVRTVANTNRSGRKQTRTHLTSDGGADESRFAKTERRSSERIDKKVQLTGSKIELALTMVDQAIGSIDQIDVKGDARFRELPTANSTTEPLSVEGQAFRLNNPDAMNAFVQSIGEPTVISTGGFVIKAANVQLDREKNLVWSKGNGVATIPIAQDFEGKPMDTPAEATVTWRDSMEFDGLLIQLHGGSVVDGPDFQMKAEHLQARLNRRVDFSATQRSQKSAKPEVEEITAQRNVRAVYETREFGRLVSSTYMRVPNVSLNPLSGDVSVNGVGQVMMTKRGFSGGDNLTGDREQQVLSGQDESEADDRLTFLQVDFQDGVTGNIETRVLEFNRKVKAIYGPVYDWNQKINPNEDPQEDDILLSCDKLMVAQGPKAADGSQAVDLRAIGNTFVEGKTFQAAGDQITYDQSKDLLILRGNRSRDGQIRYQDAKGATINKSFKEFKFFPKEKRAEASEVPMLEFRTFSK